MERGGAGDRGGMGKGVAWEGRRQYELDMERGSAGGMRKHDGGVNQIWKGAVWKADGGADWIGKGEVREV